MLHATLPEQPCGPRGLEVRARLDTLHWCFVLVDFAVCTRMECQTSFGAPPFLQGMVRSTAQHWVCDTPPTIQSPDGPFNWCPHPCVPLPLQGMVRSTAKYWVRMSDVSTVKHHILQVCCARLPLQSALHPGFVGGCLSLPVLHVCSISSALSLCLCCTMRSMHSMPAAKNPVPRVCVQWQA